MCYRDLHLYNAIIYLRNGNFYGNKNGKEKILKEKELQQDS